MQKELVNRIYWAPEYANAFTLGASGSQVTIQPNGSVHQHNALMAPGDPIMFWHSTENYQMAKTVPQLPILRQGSEYRIVIHGRSFPEQTVTYRLGFKDAQDHEVQHYYFNDNHYQFVFPEDAVNYELIILNAGATDYYFDNIELSLSQVSPAANTSFWVQKPLGAANQPRLVLLTAAGQRVKTNYPKLANYTKHFNILPIVADPQLVSNRVLTYLQRLYSQPSVKGTRLVVVDPIFNAAVLRLVQMIDVDVMLPVTEHIENLPANVTEYWPRPHFSLIDERALEDE